MQSQGCQQAMDEAEKDYKKLSERIAESREAMKVIPLSLSFQKLDLEYNINGSLFFFRLLMKSLWLRHRPLQLVVSKIESISNDAIHSFHFIL
jgi:hypothetical protein